jgi:hypothetical protein
MSKLTVSVINTENDTTPLVLSTGNTLSGFIKVETSNSDVVFSGNPRFLAGISGVAPPAAFTAANAAFEKGNTAHLTANAAFLKANTAETIGIAAFAEANTAETIGIAAFNKANTSLANATGTLNGSLTVTGNYADSKGELRDIPVDNKTSAYTLVSSDLGKTISITTGGVTVPASVFAPGDAITIYNNSASNQTITQGASVTMYLAGTATTGNRTLAQRGIATALCIATNTFVISGAGLT